jgi:hypothetical protein
MNQGGEAMTTSGFRLAVSTLIMLVWVTMPAAAAPSENQASGATTEQLQEQLRQQQERLSELEQLVRQQAQLLEMVQRKLAAAENPASPPPANGGVEAASRQEVPPAQEVERLSGELDALAAHSQAVNEKVNELEKKTEENQKSFVAKLKGLGNFSFSGDVRLRYEPFFGGVLSQDRHRLRYRLRFNAIAKLSDELTGGLSLASGDEIDPISTNQTLTGFFKRKPIGIDRAFIQYQPNWFQPLTLTGGKFAYTWYRTELTWDNDLNPEGFSETLSWDFSNPVLKKLTVVGFQLPFRETGVFDDSIVYGGQVQSYWKLSERVKFSSYAAFYNWHRADPVAVAQLNLLTPVTGGACSVTPGCTALIPNSLALGGSVNTNTIAPGDRFASKFALLDLIGRFDIDTGWARWPLTLQLDFVSNTRPCANVSVATCNPSDRSGWWAEVQFGKTQEKNDLNVGYTFIRIEREAVLAAFNFSDLRQPTNVINHRFNFGYQALKNVTLSYTLLVGRALRTATTLLPEDWLERMQFDVAYKF